MANLPWKWMRRSVFAAGLVTRHVHQCKSTIPSIRSLLSGWVAITRTPEANPLFRNWSPRDYPTTRRVGPRGRGGQSCAVVNAIVIEKHTEDIVTLVQGCLGKVVRRIGSLVLIRTLVHQDAEFHRISRLVRNECRSTNSGSCVSPASCRCGTW